jgi:hypothetical protein
MTPYGNGLPERRHDRRREEDLDPATARGYEFWVRLMFLHKGKIIMLLSTAAGVAGYLAGVYGLGMRVAKLESIVTRNSASIQQLQQSDANKVYMLCVITRATAPNLTPMECGQTIERGP